MSAWIASLLNQPSANTEIWRFFLNEQPVDGQMTAGTHLLKRDGALDVGGDLVGEGEGVALFVDFVDRLLVAVGVEKAQGVEIASGGVFALVDTNGLHAAEAGDELVVAKDRAIAGVEEKRDRGLVGAA